jgi:signal transduction histidine kinase
MPTTVLLCDTPDEVARFQYHLLREHDLEVEVTTDAFRGVEAAVRSRPDVIVSELTLEGLGGAELVKRFLASSPSSRFVAHTVVRDPVKVTEVLAAGASGYVLKEDPVEDSLRAIRAASSGAVTLSGQVAGLLSSELSRAVNRSRELEAELLTVRDDVAKGSTAKADFLSNISHELRTPVTVAKGIAYVLKNPAVPDEEKSEFLDQLSGSLDKLMGIVDEMITLSELERGTFELSLVETDLAPLVRHALDEFRMR